MKKVIKYILVSIILLMIIAFGAFYIWSEQTYKPSDELYALVGKGDIKKENGFVTFEPTKTKKVGIVLYPGAKVEPEAYGYYAKELSKEGYTVVIPNVRFIFALFDKNKATEAKDTYPEVEKWYVAGHSLGGVAASAFAYENPKEVEGIILLGSYPSDSNDFSKMKVPMLSLYAEHDGLSTVEKILKTKHLLSKEANMHKIAGGNHGQFGVYGKQKGDNEATISAKKQQEEMIAVTKKWLDQNGD
ncbi:alpha/beta hydrolase [Peribacillus frigoritolerans]|uniref:alpha/beta family hydrolase n=1 Tax=Peribacillus frigoritolerans TaxID=450367 RepID=UPI002E2268A0|nr:alpha/beta hydrolase [Peribacillus frigoritolerans]